MNLIISSDKYYSDTISKQLVDYLRENFSTLVDAILYYQYPIYIDVDDKTMSPKLLIVSPQYGIIIINCSPINDIRAVNSFDDDTTQIESLLFSKLIKSTLKELKKSKRDLSFELKSFLYLPLIPVAEINSLDLENQVVVDKNDFQNIFAVSKDRQLTEEMLKEISAILEGSKVILKPKTRCISEDDKTSKGFILSQMEQQIAYLDIDQKSAALAQINGPQRIRGLAGSGKTIILCMKAALIHLREPNKKILYTFLTRSLYDYIETMIIRFYRFFGDGSLPDFDKIQIKHSWGGNTIPGVYYSSCKNNGIMPLTFESARRMSADPFDYVCEDLLSKTSGKPLKEYDYILMDEAQDFKPSFYQLCRAIVRDDCLVWCYDDLQNIFEVKIQDTIVTFKNSYGAEGINLEKLNEQFEDLNNDVVLSKTYRNPREILVLAHAIGFGIYNSTLIQSLENKQHWIDFGYKIISGNCKIGDKMVIERPKDNSPLLISELQKPEELIELKSFENIRDEIVWIAESIEKDVNEEKINPDDIIVISLDDKNSKGELSFLSNILSSKGINTFNITDSYYSKGFIEENCVTLSTVYKAKGNEAAIVYVMGTQVFETNKNRRSMRNKIFTAFTRAKGWLKISGVDMENSQLWKEIKCVFDDNFILKFTQTETLYKIELGKKSKKAKAAAKKKIDELLKMGYSKEDIDLMIEEFKVQ